MRFSWLYLPLFLAAVAPGLACSVEHGIDPGPVDPGISGPDAALRFEQEGTIELAPGEERAVSVIVSPPARYEVSFSILGDASGAFLDRTTTVADATGRASVVLHAPSLATTFRLRAIVKNGPSAEIGVSVSDKGFATIRALPTYDGQRLATDWTASVTAGTTCAEIAATLPDDPDGALVASAPVDEAAVEVESAPVGPNLAVAIRAGRAMWGCADVADLKAGEAHDVTIAVKDGPVDLAASELDLTLTFTPTPEVGAILAATTSRVLAAFLPESAEAATLLDAMIEAAPPDLQAPLEAERAAAVWDEAVAQHLSGLPATPRDVCLGWAEAGLALTPAEITATLEGVPGVPGKAWMQITTLGGVTADDAGVPPTAHQMSWSAEPGDLLRLDGTVYWIPSRYVGAVAWQAALAEQPGAGSMGEALASATSCDALAAALVGVAGCDEACLTSLCAAALDARWSLGLDASALAGLPGSVALSASGPAVVDERALPISWSAAWLGAISDGETAATVQGEAEGVESVPVSGVE